MLTGHLTQLLAFVLGFVLQDLRVTAGIYATGFLTALFVRFILSHIREKEARLLIVHHSRRLQVVVPPWNMYRQNPVKWLPSQGAAAGKPDTVQESKKKR